MDKKQMFKIGLILFIVCAISALLLASLNMLLKDKIKANETKKVDEAIASIAGEYKAKEEKELDVEASDDAVKATAKLTSLYTVTLNDDSIVKIYTVEGKNSFGDATIMVGISDGVISKVEYVSFSQTNEPAKIKALPENEYVGKASSIDAVSNEYIKENYAGVTRGSRMMNLMMSLVLDYEAGE